MLATPGLAGDPAPTSKVERWRISPILVNWETAAKKPDSLIAAAQRGKEADGAGT